MKWLLLCFFGAIGIHISAYANDRLDFVTAVDEIYDHTTEDVSYETLTDVLWDVYQQPIDLNRTTPLELSELYILSPQQIDSLFAHLEKNGSLISIYELQAIPHFDARTIATLRPFIAVEEIYPHYAEGLSSNFIHPKYGSWLTRYERALPTPKGYVPNPKTNNTPYQGSPDKLLTRLQWKHHNGWGFGITGRKHAGEQLKWDPNTARYVFDVTTGYISLENKGYLKKIIVGNYQVGCGQGILLNTAFGGNKSTDPMYIMRTSNTGLQPHRSFSNYGFTGIGTTLRWKAWEQTLYYAYNDIDGKVEGDAEGNKSTQSVQRSGYHRTIAQINKKSQVNEQLMGTTVVYKPKEQDFEIGLSSIYTWYAIPHSNPRKNLDYKFEGKENWNLGIFYNYLWRSIHFFGEGALSKSGGKAGLVGAIASIAYVDLSFVLRNYQPNFHSFYGKAFGEGSTNNQNEKGIYVGMSIQPIKKLKIGAYYDYFYFPKPTAMVATAAAGYDWRAKLNYQISKNILWMIQYKEKAKCRNIPKKDHNKPAASQLTNLAETVAQGKTRNYKLQYRHKLDKRFSLESEIQTTTYGLLKKFTYGYGLGQKCTYKYNKVAITGQIVWFDTDYLTRLYMYEKGPLYSESRPSMYYNKGIKPGIAIAYKPTTNWRLEGKYSCMWIWNQDHIGSGNDMIMSNVKHSLQFQLIYSF